MTECITDGRRRKDGRLDEGKRESVWKGRSQRSGWDKGRGCCIVATLLLHKFLSMS